MTEHRNRVYSTNNMGEMGKLGTAERSVAFSHQPVDPRILGVLDESEEENECDADTRAEEEKKSENEEAETYTFDDPHVPSYEPFAPAGAAISQRAGSEVPKKTAEASDSSTTSARGELELQAVEYLQEELIDEVSALTAISVRDFMDISDVHFGAMVHQSLRLIVSFCHLAARPLASCDVDDSADPTDRNQRKEEGAALLLELMQSAKPMLSVGMTLLHIFKQQRTGMKAEEEGRNVDAAKKQDEEDEERRRTFLFILRSVITALKRFMAWRQGLPPPAAAPVVGRRRDSQDRPFESDVHLQSPMEVHGHADEGELAGVGQLEAVISDFDEDADSDHSDTAPIGKPDEQQALTDSLGDDDEDADVIITGLMGEVADQEVPQLAEEVRRPLADAPTADTVLHQGHNLRQLVDVLREACQIGAVPSWQDLAGLVLVLLRSSRGVAQFTALSTRRRLLALECVVVRLVGEAVRHARGMARLMQIAAAAAQQRNEDLVEAYSAAVHETRQGLRVRLGDLLSAVGQLLTAVHHEWFSTAGPSSPRAPSSQSQLHPIGNKGEHS